MHYSILTKHFCNMKIIMHTCNGLVKPTFINSLPMYGTRITEITKIHGHFAQYRHLNVTFKIRRLEPSKLRSNPIDLFMH